MNGKFRDHTKLNKNSGFSFVELIVVIVITMILASAATIGISSWIVRSNFDKQNNYARTMFAAAQNQLTEYEMQGTVSEFGSIFLTENYEDGLVLLADSEHVYQNAIRERKADGRLEDEEECLNRIWREAEKAAEDARKRNAGTALAGESADTGASYRGTIVSVLLTEQDYEKYAKQDKNLSPHKKAVYDLFSDYLYDMSILKAPVCVELCPEAGMVFSVFYSEYATQFCYDEGNKNTSGLVDIADRDYDVRKGRMVGYYGVNELGRSTSTERKRPVIGDVQLVNEDTLRLKFNLSKVSGATGSLVYDVTVYDSATQKPKLMLRFSNVKNNTAFLVNRVTDVKAYYPRKDGEEIDENCPYRIYPMIAWVDRENYVNLILDAADLQASSEAYLNEYALLSDTGNLNTMTDSGAGYEMNMGKYGAVMASSFSFRRFGVSAENIYCKVQGHGSTYQTTAQKRSNIQNTYFAAASAEETAAGTSLQIELANARHLYNVRYLEDYDAFYGFQRCYAKIADITFSVTQKIDWSGFQDLYDSTGWSTPGEGRQVYSGEEKPFPSMKQLRKGDVLKGKPSYGVSSQTISGLHITAENNAKYLYPVSGKGAAQEKSREEGWAGLILQNFGSIQDLTLDRIRVEGEKNVGAFCGVDSGEGFSNLSVGHTGEYLAAEGRSLIEGRENVGGVAGLGRPEGQTPTDVLYRKIVNYAKVAEKASGQSGSRNTSANFGGIAGLLDYSAAGEKSIVLGAADASLMDQNGCYNYGQITALSHDTAEGQTENLGGIVGKCQGSTIKIYNCKAAPLYDPAQVSGEAELKKLLNGWYVGGIVGYNKGASILESSTAKPSAESEGYVFGDCYVGGIIGFNEGTQARLSGLRRTAGGKEEITDNQGHIMGNRFVGGIVGYNPEGTVEGWCNTGFVGAALEYAGGAAGANGYVREALDQSGNAQGRPDSADRAKILKCTSNVGSSAIIQKLTALELFGSASFVGGMTGYNDGRIIYNEGDPEDFSGIVVNVSGGNFVGGIVGYNDVHSEVAGFAVGGGSVRGKNYVGGFAGFNGSVNLLMKESGGSYEARVLKSNPNLVLGDYCVGGTIGGNVVPTERDVKALFSASNFLGYVGCVTESGGSEARAFVGGFIGYNQLLANGYGDHKDVLMKKISESTERFADAKKAGLGTKAGDLEALTDCLPKFGAGDYTGLAQAQSDFAMEVLGDNSGQTGNSKFGAVCGYVFVGGVLGYQDEDSALLVQNVKNMSVVRAMGYLTNPAERVGKSGKTFDGKEFSYSYAGGILGKVGEKVTIDNCSNSEQGMVISLGTYTGALCEVNDGEIRNCSVQSIGSDTVNYVGGIAGVNNDKGRISACRFEGSTVTGANYVGGIAAENFGVIRDVTVTSAIVTASGEHVGGLTGYNYQGAAIYNSAGNVSVQATVSGKRYVGGIAGTSEEQIGSSDGIIAVEGSISANTAVGGAVGLYRANRPMTRILNKASVTAVEGDAGGIVGIIEKAAAMQEVAELCVNLGAVSSNKTGNAGGIVADNQGKLKNCGNGGAVSAPGGTAGGIAATNRGEIRGCYASVSKEAADSLFAMFGLAQSGERRQISALNEAGGIAGINEEGGIITGSTAELLSVQNLPGSPKDSVIGGIAGKNQGVIESSKVSDCLITSVVSEAHSGGIAGLNRRAASGAAAEQGILRGDVVEKTIVTMSKGLWGNLGGAAGKNEKDAVITGVTVCADIVGMAGREAFGYGGIAGINAGLIERSEYSARTDSTAKVGTDRKVTGENHGVSGSGSTANLANIGGAAGRNEVTGLIRETVIGTKYDTGIIAGTTSDNGAFAGGIAGYNFGQIRECDNYTASKKHVELVGFAGHLGGIAGENAPGAVVTGSEKIHLSSGGDWKVTACHYSNDCGTAGIIGHSYSGEDIAYVDNHASVYQLSTTGGIANRTVGGLIGRYENRESMVTTISYCNNFGDIIGNSVSLAGGLIGRDKYKGAANFLFCNNYGRVEGITAGGIVGDTHQTDAGTIVLFQSCANYGQITACPGSANDRYIGGILANTLAQVDIYVMDCVNVGNLVVNTDVRTFRAAGILGGTTNQNHFYRCRNYGNFLYSDGTAVAPGDGRKGNDFLQNKCFAIENSGTTAFMAKECMNLAGNVYKLCRQSSCKNAEKNYSVKVSGVGEASHYPAGVSLLEESGTNRLKAADDSLDLRSSSLKMALVKTDASEFLWEDYLRDPGKHAGGSHIAAEGYRQKVYEEIDRQYISQLPPCEVEGTPVITSVSQSAVRLVVNWKPAAKCAYQQIYYVPEGGEPAYSPVLPYDMQSYGYDCSEWVGREVTIYVLALDSDGEVRAKSQPWKTVIQNALPTPKVHLELTGTDGYLVVLENMEDYAAYPDAVIRVKDRDDKKMDFTIEIADGSPFSNVIQMGNVSRNYYFTAWAEQKPGSANPCAPTAQTITEYFMMGEQRLLSSNTENDGNDYAKTTFYKDKNAFFAGALPQDFVYQLQIQGNRDLEAFTLSELMMKNYRKAKTAEETPYDFDVVVSYGETHIAGNQTFVNKLGDLPEDIWELETVKMTARTFIWQSQAHITWFGHIVEGAENITWEEMEKYIDRADTEQKLVDRWAVHEVPRGETPVFVKNGDTVGLNKGYQMRLNKDGTYTVYFSVFFADEKSWLNSNVTDQNQMKIRSARAVDTCDFTEKINENRQPAPDIKVNQPYRKWQELYAKDGDNYVKISYNEAMECFVGENGRMFTDSVQLYVPGGDGTYHKMAWDAEKGVYYDAVKKAQAANIFHIRNVIWNNPVNKDANTGTNLDNAKWILAGDPFLVNGAKQSLFYGTLNSGTQSIEFVFNGPLDLSAVKLNWSAGVSVYRRYTYYLQVKREGETKYTPLSGADGNKAVFINLGTKDPSMPDYEQMAGSLCDPIEEYLSAGGDAQALKNVTAVQICVTAAENVTTNSKTAKKTGNGGTNLPRVYFQGTLKCGVTVDTQKYAYTLYSPEAPEAPLYIETGGSGEGYIVENNNLKSNTMNILQPSMEEYAYCRQDGYYLGERGYLVDEEGRRQLDWEGESEGSADVLRIDWDVKGTPNYEADAVYGYLIRGSYTEDGELKTVLIDSGSYATAENGGLNHLEYPDTAKWRYTDIEISITRGAKLDANGAVVKFAKTAKKSVRFVPRLSQIAMPMTTITGKNALLYRIAFSNIPKEEREFAAGYEITVKDVTKNVKPERIKEETRWTFRYENGSYTLTKLGRDGTVFEGEGMNTAPSKENLTAVIDLRRYNGCTVEISVRVLAVKDCGYRDGARGVPAELSLTNRLGVPRANRLTNSPAYSLRQEDHWWNPDTFMTLEELAAVGQKLTYTADADENVSDLQAKYEIAAAVYKERPADYDSDGEISGNWNDGAVCTLVYKEGETDASGNPAEALRMTGSLSESYFQFNRVTKVIAPEYAGYWLKIALRAVSDSNVSSYWSDEDEAGASVNYAWLQIPRVQLPAPGLAAVKYAVENVYHAPDGTDHDFGYYRRKMEVRPGEPEGDLLITTLRKGVNDTEDVREDYLTAYTDWLYLERIAEGQYRVYYATTDPKVSIAPGDGKTIPGIPEMTCLGTLDAAAPVSAPYEVKTALIEVDGQILSEAATGLTLSIEERSGDAVVVLELADVLGSASGTTLQTNFVTDQVTVQAVSPEPERYENSRIALWYDGMKGESGILEHGAAAEELAGKLSASVSLREGYRYEIFCQNRYPLLYEISASGQTRYLTSYSSKDNMKDMYAFLPESWFAEGGCFAQASSLSIRAAQITETEGLGEFSGAVLLELPAVPANIAELLQGGGQYDSVSLVWDTAVMRQVEIVTDGENGEEIVLGVIAEDELRLAHASVDPSAPADPSAAGTPVPLFSREWTVTAKGNGCLVAAVSCRELEAGRLELRFPREESYVQTAWSRQTQGQKVKFAVWRWKIIPK